jgi:uncharacterized membrane protein YeaQ/YmgE (transglycosylase-associated protein family)
MFGFIGWLIVGLIAGWLAKLIVPGREPGGFLATMVIGLAGSLIGGFIATNFLGWGNNPGGSILIAFLGAVLLLFGYHALNNNRGRV